MFNMCGGLLVCDYQDSITDVILKCTPDEARNLKTYGEFPESVCINDTVTFVEDALNNLSLIDTFMG